METVRRGRKLLGRVPGWSVVAASFLAAMLLLVGFPAAIFAFVTMASQDTDVTTQPTTQSVGRIAQKFTVGANDVPVRVRLRLDQSGTGDPGVVAIEIAPDSSGSPGGPGLCSNTFAGSNLPSADNDYWEIVTLAGCPTLVTSTDYWLVLVDTEELTGYVRWKAEGGLSGRPGYKTHDGHGASLTRTGD